MGRAGNADFDVAAAVTRSMLGWGVVAGPFYLVFGLILAFSREGYRLSVHALSLLMLGEHGWLQMLNLGLAGLMTVVAGWGMRRAITAYGHGPGRGAGTAVMVAGAAMILGVVFRPDPVPGFPPGTTATSLTVPGALHLLAGTVEFVALAVAGFLLARFLRTRGEPSTWSWGTAVALLATFLAGAALSAGPIGVALLWIAVILAFTWLLTASLRLYLTVPHPDGAARQLA